MSNTISTFSSTPYTKAKQAAGQAALEFIEDGMLVGVGTGSTISFFISGLIEKSRQGLNITAIATSQETQKLICAGGIRVVDINDFPVLDLTVDGADEVDMQKRMIKGGGGALLREKIVATASREVIIIVDESKVVHHLGSYPLAVEIVPFGYKVTLRKFIEFGYRGVLRHKSDGKLYITDNGNYIVDIHFHHPIDNPETEHQTILNIPGVVDTGFFFNLANRIVVGYADGHVEIRN